MVTLILRRGERGKQALLSFPAQTPAASDENAAILAALRNESAPVFIESAASPVLNLGCYLRGVDILVDGEAERIERLAERLEQMSEIDCDKFSGMLDANSISGTKDILKLTEQLDDYTILPNCSSPRSIGRYGIMDNCCMTVALIGVSMPNFWQGLLLMLLFSLKLHWLPATGVDTWDAYILPAVTIGTSCCGIITRLTRSSMLDVVNSDYVTTARAKGQKERVVILKHCLKNALIPIITAAGIQFGAMLGGSLLTETVFAVPGIGLLLTNAVKARNYPVVQGGVLFVALVFSLVNLGVDLLYALVDPRVKSNYK